MSDDFDHTLEHKLGSKRVEAGGTARDIRRIELITGTGRRRSWSVDDKARILAASMRPGANVSEVARRHGLSPQQLFGWRREARARTSESADTTPQEPVEQAKRAVSHLAPEKALGCERAVVEGGTAFAPVVVAFPTSPPPSASTPTQGVIEIIVGDAIVRVGGWVEPQLLIAVLSAVRRAS